MEAVCRCDPAMTTGFVLGLCAFKIIESVVKFYSKLEDDIDDKLREEIRVEFELQETIEKLAEQERKLSEQKRILAEQTKFHEKNMNVNEWVNARKEIETPAVHFLPPHGNSKYASLASISQDAEDRALKRKKFVESLPPSVNPNLSEYSVLNGFIKNGVFWKSDPLSKYQFEGNSMSQESKPSTAILFDSGAFISNETPNVIKSLRAELPDILKTLKSDADTNAIGKYSFIDDDEYISPRDLQSSFI